jgi:hypothetical protein
MERVHPTGDGRILVFDAGRLVGIVSPSDIARAIQATSLPPVPA